MNGEHRAQSIVVVVVEDDPLLLLDALDLIEDAGHVAYGARNADEAIALMEAHPDIRVLFTDVDMPGDMDGLKLARYVRERWPPVTIIVTTGLQGIQETDLPERGLFFPKPYAPGSVIQALKDVASRGPGA